MYFMDGVARVKIGISGFDELVEGGVPEGANVLLTGTPGTAKTIFGIQYLCNGAAMGEPGVYVSLDESRDNLEKQAKAFGYDLERFEKEGTIAIVDIPLDMAGVNIFESIDAGVKKINAKRLVFDSLVTFAVNIDQFIVPLGYRLSDVDASYKNTSMDRRVPYEGKSERRITYLLINELGKLGTTNIVITAAPQAGDHLTVDGVSEFACDGVIEFFNLLVGANRARTMAVLKMRDTNHSQYIHDFELGEKGIVVKPAERVYK